jgi:hypothetical protein
MFSRSFTELALILVVCSALVPAADNETGWKVLKEQITRRRNYNFLLREGRCLTGWIDKVGDNDVEVTTGSNGKPVRRTLVRRDILQVTDTLPGLVYSGRSSWVDVRSTATDLHGLRMRVITKAGQTVAGIGVSASESDLTLKTADGKVKSAKPDVARVELVREKPWSDRAEFAGQELGKLAVIEPEIWPHLLHATGVIDVPLYDASEVEDNSQTACAKQD